MIALGNQVKSKLVTIAHIFAYSFLGFYFGFNMAIFNTLINPLMSNYTDYTQEDIKTVQSLLNTFFCLGSLVCCFFGSLVFTKFGLHFSTIIFLALNILYDGLACINNLYFLYVLRFFAGINGVMWTFLGPLMIQKCVFSELKIQL